MSIESIVSDWKESVAGRKHTAKQLAIAGKSKYFLSKAWQTKRNRMGVLVAYNRDVWVIDPNGNKHYPDGRIEART